MVNEKSVLGIFFEQEIFDLDEEEVEEFLCSFSEEEISEGLIRRLELASLSKDEVEETSWKLGRIFGGYKKISADNVLVSRLSGYSSIMKMACFNFLSGYWDEVAPDFMCLKSFLNFTSESISDSAWSGELSESAVEAVAAVYGNNKSVFMQSNELLELLDIVRSYAKNNITDSPGKSLLTRGSL